MLADQVRRLPQSCAHTQIDTRLAKMDWEQLRVTIGEMQKVNVAEARHVVHACSRWGRSKCVARRDRHPTGRGDGKDLQELAPIHYCVANRDSAAMSSGNISPRC